MYNFFLKRFIDLVLSLIGFLLTLPLFLIVGITLFIIYKSTPFFFQKRPGKNEKVFKIIKFKTMNDKKDQNGNLLPDEERLTRIGNFIRKTSLDEIPQFINIIKGDMSLVGPRPLRVHYLPYYTKEEKVRHSIRPGVTGLAQVSGRNNLGWDEKLQKDIDYVKNISFFLDIKILFKTVLKVINPKDVVLDDTMLTFDEYRRKTKKS